MSEPGIPATDEDLAAACQGGDYAAFEELYQRWHRPMLSYLHQITRDYDEAACVAQDVFLRVFEHIGRFDNQRRFSTWLYTVARNIAMDRLSARSRRTMASLDDLDAEDRRLPEPTASASAVEAVLARRESDALLATALGDLPQIHREIIELIIFQGIDYEEAGRILGGVAAGTLRSRMHHALKRLRLELERTLGKDADQAM